MTAKKKAIDALAAAELGVDVTPRLTIEKTTPPPTRQGGVKLASVEELVAKLKEAGALA
jgi:electron transfer flavoprotein beta subunit